MFTMILLENGKYRCELKFFGENYNFVVSSKQEFLDFVKEKVVKHRIDEFRLLKTILNEIETI